MIGRHTPYELVAVGGPNAISTVPTRRRDTDIRRFLRPRESPCRLANARGTRRLSWSRGASGRFPATVRMVLVSRVVPPHRRITADTSVSTAPSSECGRAHGGPLRSRTGRGSDLASARQSDGLRCRARPADRALLWPEGAEPGRAKERSPGRLSAAGKSCLLRLIPRPLLQIEHRPGCGPGEHSRGHTCPRTGQGI